VTELEVGLTITAVSAIIGPIVVAKYKHYLATQKKKEDPVVSSIKANMLIDDQLEQLKTELGACRVWISQFHNGGNFYPTGKSISKFSIFHEKLNPGVKGIRETYTNIPVSLFTKPFMFMYENGEILIPNHKKSDEFGLSVFADGTGAKSSYMFSLNSINDEFIGTLGIEYCSRAKNLNEEQLNEARTKAITIGTLLSTYLYTTSNTKK
jgi:hypothetical protein